MARHTAFEILYQEYYVRVFGLCRRLLSSAELAEDATQETFVRAYKNFAKFDAKKPFWQWIAAIANNHCIDVLRRRDNNDNLFGSESDELAAIADEGADIGASLTASEDAQAVNHAIEQLPDRYRVPLVLAYFNELSYAQIAEHLEIEKSHVGVLLLRAKKQLRQMLSSPKAASSEIGAAS